MIYKTMVEKAQERLAKGKENSKQRLNESISTLSIGIRENDLLKIHQAIEELYKLVDNIYDKDFIKLIENL